MQPAKWKRENMEESQQLQWNPDFSNPRFPLDLPHSSSIISTPISQTPGLWNPGFLKTPNNSNQFWLPWDELTLDNSNLRKIRNHLVRKSITFTPLNKLTLPDKLFSRILITQQAPVLSVISLKGTMTVKISALTPNHTIPGQLSVIWCHFRFLELPISRTNLRSPWRFEKSSFHCNSFCPRVQETKLNHNSLACKHTVTVTRLNFSNE